jgi:hypothetical protein
MINSWIFDIKWQIFMEIQIFELQEKITMTMQEVPFVQVSGCLFQPRTVI